VQSSWSSTRIWNIDGEAVADRRSESIHTTAKFLSSIERRARLGVDVRISDVPNFIVAKAIPLSSDQLDLRHVIHETAYYEERLIDSAPASAQLDVRPWLRQDRIIHCIEANQAVN
jgi:hypothetical protein